MAESATKTVQLIFKPSQTFPQEVLSLPQSKRHPSREEPRSVEESKINK